MKPAKRTTLPIYVKYCNLAMSGMAATCLVQPLDLIKTQFQLAGMPGMEKTRGLAWIRKVYGNYGVRAFYKGLTANFLRQGTYGALRLSIYQEAVEIYQREFKRNPTVLAITLMAAYAGACGGLSGTPSEVILLRMTAENNMPRERRRNYRCATQALRGILQEEGVMALWRGADVTIARAMFLNVVQLLLFSNLKIMLRDKYQMSEGPALFACAGAPCGVLGAIVSLPIDFARTRIQATKGKESQDAIAIIGTTIRNEGFFSLWRGFTPYVCRMVTQLVVTLIILDKINGFYRRNMLKLE